jgi:protein O-GlcNAc transferase
MAENSEALAIAIGHHQAGRLDVAEQIYRQILAVNPDQADRCICWGVVASQLGKNEVAVAYISRAIELKRTESAFQSNLGHVLQIQRRLCEAVASYQRALELKPGFAEAHNRGRGASMRLLRRSPAKRPKSESQQK